MQAVILAAGMGRRLKELTQDKTKCMVEVNGVPLIKRLLGQLDDRKLTKIVIVVGYEGQKLIDYVQSLPLQTPVEFVNNPIYDKTNNIYSLALAKDYLLEEDTLLFESDLIFENSAIDAIVDDPRETLALVDKYEAWMDGTCVVLNENDDIVSFVPGKNFDYADKDSYYKTVNIYKFSKHFSQTHYVPFLVAYQKALGENEYYEQVLRVIAMLDNPEIKAKRLNGQLWYEIDDIQDLDIASSMFANSEEERVSLMNARYGGYWRYPKLLDYCYLVNPYFPPKKLVDELKSSFEVLLTQYPSGQNVNSLLAAKNFNIHRENIVVGNGAAELIKSLMSDFTGKVGVIRPTFEEYGHRFDEENIVAFWPQNDNYSYDSEDLINFFGDKGIDNLILINPDNPSGNYLVKEDLMKLIDWADSKGINLVVDESFVDFSDEADSTIIKQDIVDKYKSLYIMKSISKSYGVPGLRLGVMVSGNVDKINHMKKDVAIWNINSFGEFYMQISHKYEKAYAAALELFREERKRFEAELNKFDLLRVVPSQANYFLVEIKDKMTAKELQIKLLDGFDILIKDLTPKMKNTNGKQYVRIAIRNKEDNDKLIQALNQILG